MNPGSSQQAGNGDWSTWRRLVLQGIEDLKADQRDLGRRVDANRDNVTRRMNDIEIELKLFKTKVTVLAGVVSAVVAFIAQIAVKYL